MSLVYPALLKAIIVFIVGNALAFFGVIIYAKATGDGSNSQRTFLRAIFSVFIFVIIYYGASFVTGSRVFDSDWRTVNYLAAVVGAGCYWIGSRK